MRDNGRGFLVFGLVMVLLIPFAALAQGQGPASAAEEAQAPYVSPSTVKDWQKAGEKVFFLDVRQKDEFAAGHLPGAVNVVYTEVGSLAKSLPHDRPIVAYCIHSSHRAPAAAKALRELGFANAYVLEGGIVAWEAGGLTIRSSYLARKPKILPVTERCSSKAKA